MESAVKLRFHAKFYFICNSVANYAPGGGKISSPDFFAISITRGMVFADGHHAPPWAGSKRATQVISSSDDVAGQSQLADDRVFPARAGGDGIRDEAGGITAAGQT